MRGVYTANIECSGIVAAKTLLLLVAPQNKILEIYSASVTNKSNETNEQLHCCFQKVSSLGVATGTNAIISKHEGGDQAAAFVASGNLTSEPTYGTAQFGKEGYPTLGGWRFEAIPETRFTVNPSELGVGLRLIEAPSSSFDAIISVTAREIG